MFSKSEKHFDRFLQETSSGQIGFNDVLIQGASKRFELFFYLLNTVFSFLISLLSVESLPFGGVGDSGMGSYHGKYSMEAFSHRRAVFKASFTGDGLLR